MPTVRSPDGPIPPKEPWRPTRGHGHPGGRPSGLTMDVGTAILDAVEIGVSTRQAIKRAGVPFSTAYGWIERGEKEDDPDSVYTQFSDAIKKAEGEAVYRSVLQVYNGSDKWQASAWWLERKYPDDWGLKKDQFPVGQVIFQKANPDKPEDHLDPGLVDTTP